jgi:hypothetical protein
MKNLEKAIIEDGHHHQHHHEDCSGIEEWAKNNSNCVRISRITVANEVGGHNSKVKIHTICIELKGSIDVDQLKRWFATVFWELEGESRPIILRVKGMTSVIDSNEKHIIQGMI